MSSNVDIENVLHAISERDLSKWLKREDVAREIIEDVSKETGLNRIVVRLAYHWLLILAIEKAEKAAEKGISLGAKQLSNIVPATLSHPLLKPMFRPLIKGIEQLEAKRTAEATRRERLTDLVGPLDERLSLEHLFQEVQLKEFESQSEFRDSALEGLRQVADEFRRQPQLDLELAPSENARFVYRSRGFPLVGRSSELSQLEGFLNQKEHFSWWTIFGAGGTGKSRLTLEFMLSVGGVWRCGYLRAQWEGWADWQPVLPTLLVVDYAGSRPTEIGQMLETLGRRSDDLKFPVRVLLLERGLHGSWYDDLTGGKHSVRWSTHLEPNLYSAPLELQSLKKQDIEKLIRQVSTRAGSVPHLDPQKTYEVLSRIDPNERRALFAIYLADAVAEGKDPEDWDKVALLTHALDRTERLYFDQVEEDGDERTALAISTMCGGIYTDDLAGDKFRPIIAARPSRGFAERYGRMVGREVNLKYSPLEPDILGEYFVLKHCENLTRFEGSTRNRALFEVAWEHGSFNVAKFFERTHSDLYPQMSTIDLLLAFIPEGDAEQAWSSTMTSIAKSLIADGQIDHLVHVFNQISELEDSESSCSTERYGVLCLMAIDLFNNNLSLDTATRVFQRLRSLKVVTQIMTKKELSLFDIDQLEEFGLPQGLIDQISEFNFGSVDLMGEMSDLGLLPENSQDLFLTAATAYLRILSEHDLGAAIYLHEELSANSQVDPAGPGSRLFKLLGDSLKAKGSFEAFQATLSNPSSQMKQILALSSVRRLLDEGDDWKAANAFCNLYDQDYFCPTDRDIYTDVTGLAVMIIQRYLERDIEVCQKIAFVWYRLLEPQISEYANSEMGEEERLAVASCVELAKQWSDGQASRRE